MVSGNERKKLRTEIPEIRAQVRKAFPGETPHHVSEIYATIIDLIGDRKKIPDSAFLPGTMPYQASWEDWGKGYKEKPRKLDAEGNILEGTKPDERATHVIVNRFATRTDAIAVLTAVAGQGEAPHLRKNRKKERSHFDRFLQVWREYVEHVMTKDLKRTRWQPARDVPRNPTTIATVRHEKEFTFIESERSRSWASLFNVRYRMLLTYLAHTFRLARSTSPTDPSVRAATMHRVFAEMYNLKTLSGILVHLPFKDSRRKARAGGKGGARRGASPMWAGPPFEMPYSLELPPSEADCWRVHRDLLESSRDLSHELMKRAPAGGKRYLKVLLDIDHQSVAWLNELLGEAGAAPGSGA
jgi:hypothetical protein